MRDRDQVVFPLNLEIRIPKDDFVFTVAKICEEPDYAELFGTYVRAWRKVNPITLFEILIFAYINRKFSSREIETLKAIPDKKNEYYSHLGKFGVESEYIVGLGVFSNRMECFIKPQNYEISKKRTCKTNLYSVENMAYDAKRDAYTCPNGRKLKFKRESIKTTENGYNVSTKYYSNDKCGRCPHREKCHKSKNGFRTVKVNQVFAHNHFRIEKTQPHPKKIDCPTLSCREDVRKSLFCRHI